jgi:hypothetical protein
MVDQTAAPIYERSLLPPMRPEDKRPRTSDSRRFDPILGQRRRRRYLASCVRFEIRMNAPYVRPPNPVSTWRAGVAAPGSTLNERA